MSFKGVHSIPQKTRKNNKFIDPDTLPIDDVDVKEIVGRLGKLMSTFIKSVRKIKADLFAIKEETEDPATRDLIKFIIDEVIEVHCEPEYKVNGMYEDILEEQHKIEEDALRRRHQRERSSIFN